MSAYGIIRSFAEAREHDDAPVRNGITYGTARELASEIDHLRADLVTAWEALEQAGRDICECGCARDYPEDPHCRAHKDVMAALDRLEGEDHG